MSKKSFFSFMALPAISALFLLSCLGPSEEQKYSWFAPYERALDVGNDKGIWEKHVNFMRSCMEEKGFKFIVPPFRDNTDRREKSKTVEYAQEYGYGLLIPPPEPEGSEEYKEYMDSLSEDELSGWQAAYHGDADNVGCIDSPDYPLKFIEKYQELFEKYHRIDSMVFDEKEAVDRIPSWAKCMAERGYKREDGSEYSSFDEPIREIEKAAKPENPESPSLDEESLENLREREKATAARNAACLQELNFWDVYAKVQNRLREKFVKDNEKELEEFMNLRK